MGGLHEDYERLFHDEYQPVLRTVFLICHDHHRAEDVVQDAFVQLFRHWDEVKRLERPGAWLRRVAVRLAVRSLRRDAARRNAERRSTPPYVDYGRDTEILTAIGTLPARQRAAVVLFYYEDRPTPEVAEILGCSVATARVHLHRGRRRLADALEGAEVIDHATE